MNQPYCCKQVRFPWWALLVLLPLLPFLAAAGLAYLMVQALIAMLDWWESVK